MVRVAFGNPTLTKSTAVTTAVDKWPAYARLLAVAPAGHLPTAPTPLSGTRPCFGRRADRSACHCAVVARYSKLPLRVEALRRSSREIVEAARPSRRATSRIEQPCTRRSAISSRSENKRYRPDSAASSVAMPAAIAAQNRRCSSRAATTGRPGESNGARPDRSERRLRLVIATPPLKCCDDHLSPACEPWSE